MFPFPGYVFILCFWVVHDVRLGVRKNVISVKRKIKYNDLHKVLETNEVIKGSLAEKLPIYERHPSKVK